MATPTNFYSAMFGMNNNKEPTAAAGSPSEKVVADNAVVAQDEAIGRPWTHRFTLYVNNPTQGFMDALNSLDGIVAVYSKEKEDKPSIADASVPNN